MSVFLCFNEKRDESLIAGILKMQIGFFLLFATTLILLSSCQKEFVSADYLPLKQGYSWAYNFGSMVIEESFATSKEGATGFRGVFYDTLGSPVWLETYLLDDDKVYWTSFQPKLKFMPGIVFNPPVQLSPISDKPGDHKTVTVQEIWDDSLKTTQPVNVEYQVEEIEDIPLLSGQYVNCIRMRMSFIYLGDSKQTYFAGANTLWFSRGKGIVRFIMPSGYGTLKSTEPISAR
jgi:hypothetical protein